MDDKRKERLRLLKDKNKEIQARKRVEENILLKECISSLAFRAVLLTEEKKKEIYEIFEKIPFLPWGIDWKYFKSVYVVNNAKELKEVCINTDFYIIWSAELPIIKSDLVTIIECIDEISAVEPDTWLLSLNYNEVIEVYHEGKITVGTVSEER